MSKPQATQILGVLALLFGGWWLWVCAVGPAVRWIRDIGEGFELSSLFFGFFTLAIASVGIALVIGGICLIRNKPRPEWMERLEVSEEDRLRVQLAADPIATYVRWTLGLLALFGVMAFPAYFEKPLNEFVPESISSTLLMLVGTLVVVPIYIWLVRFFLRRRGYPMRELREVIGKAGVFLVAIQLWLVLSSIGEITFFSNDDASSRIISGVGMMWTFGPIAVAWLFYKLTVRGLRIDELELDLRRTGFDPRTGNG